MTVLPKTTVYERWYKAEDGSTWHELYVLESGNKRVISSCRTPYLGPPIIVINGHLPHEPRPGLDDDTTTVVP